MSPVQKATRLIDIADLVDSARHLVEAGIMATEDLSKEEGSALAELLGEVSDRLKAASADISALVAQT